VNPAIYTKNGQLRKNPPPQYVRRFDKTPVPNNILQKVKLPGITFLIGPNGEALDDNPDYMEWMRLNREQESFIFANRV